MPMPITNILYAQSHRFNAIALLAHKQIYVWMYAWEMHSTGTHLSSD